MCLIMCAEGFRIDPNWMHTHPGFYYYVSFVEADDRVIIHYYNDVPGKGATLATHAGHWVLLSLRSILCRTYPCLNLPCCPPPHTGCRNFCGWAAAPWGDVAIGALQGFKDCLVQKQLEVGHGCGQSWCRLTGASFLHAEKPGRLVSRQPQPR